MPKVSRINGDEETDDEVKTLADSASTLRTPISKSETTARRVGICASRQSGAKKLQSSTVNADIHDPTGLNLRYGD